MNKTITVLEQITQLLITGNVAVPIISGVIMSIAAIIKGVTGTGPSLKEIADMLEKQVGQNDATIRAEIARLEAMQPPHA